MKKIIIAIDGFSSCGKSTMAKELAREIGYIYIDSGAMYRAVTWYCLQNGFFNENILDVNSLKEKIDSVEISFRRAEGKCYTETYLNGINVEKEIRSMEVAAKVSIVSAIPFVRHRLVKLQQEMGNEKGIVMDGRDIGTVVFPDAEMKVFVTASTYVRAERRLCELREKGDSVTTFEQVMGNIKERDYMDENRAESPLKKAKDAFYLDNSYITIEEQRQWLLNEFNKAINGKN